MPVTKSTTYQSWIETGYLLFAKEGMEGIQVERLARKLDLNKSGFYHHFKGRDAYIGKLMEYHHLRCDQIVREIGMINTFDPDYLHVLMKYKVTVMVHMQMVRNRHVDVFVRTLLETNQRIDNALIPLWSSYLGIPDQPEIALRYYEIVHDTFFARVTFETMSFEFLHQVASDAKTVIEVLLKNEKRTSVTTG